MRSSDDFARQSNEMASECEQHNKHISIEASIVLASHIRLSKASYAYCCHITGNNCDNRRRFRVQCKTRGAAAVAIHEN